MNKKNNKNKGSIFIKKKCANEKTILIIFWFKHIKNSSDVDQEFV